MTSFVDKNNSRYENVSYVTKLDHIESEHGRGTLHIKETIVNKDKNERNDGYPPVV